MSAEFPQQFKRDVYQKAVARRNNIPQVLQDRNALIERLSSPAYSKYKKSDALIDMAQTSIARATGAVPIADLNIVRAKTEIRDDLEDTVEHDPSHLEYWEGFYGLKLEDLKQKEIAGWKRHEGGKRPMLRERSPYSHERFLVYLGSGVFSPLTLQGSKIFRDAKTRGPMSIERIAEMTQGKTDEIAVQRSRTSISQLNKELSKFGAKVGLVGKPGSPYGLTGIRAEADLGLNTQQIIEVNGKQITMPTRLLNLLKALGSAESVSKEETESILYPEFSPRNKAKVVRVIQNINRRIAESGYEVIDQEGAYRFKKIPENIMLNGRRIVLTPQMLKLWKSFDDKKIHEISNIAVDIFGKSDSTAIESTISLISDLNDRIQEGNVQINRESLRGNGKHRYQKVDFDTFRPHAGTRSIDFRGTFIAATASEREIISILEKKPSSVEEMMELTGRSFESINASMWLTRIRLRAAKSDWTIGRITKRSGKRNKRIQIYDIVAN